MQVANSESSISGIRSSRWASTSAGGRSTAARVRTAVRIWPIALAACVPWPITSPITSATRPPDSAITSNQSPPTTATSLPGRYRCAISSPAGADSFVGSIAFCMLIAVCRSWSCSRALSIQIEARAATRSIEAISAGRNGPRPGLREKTITPSTRPPTSSGANTAERPATSALTSVPSALGGSTCRESMITSRDRMHLAYGERSGNTVTSPTGQARRSRAASSASQAAKASRTIRIGPSRGSAAPAPLSTLSRSRIEAWSAKPGTTRSTTSCAVIVGSSVDPTRTASSSSGSRPPRRLRCGPARVAPRSDPPGPGSGGAAASTAEVVLSIPFTPSCPSPDLRRAPEPGRPAARTAVVTYPVQSENLVIRHPPGQRGPDSAARRRAKTPRVRSQG